MKKFVLIVFMCTFFCNTLCAKRMYDDERSLVPHDYMLNWRGFCDGDSVLFVEILQQLAFNFEENILIEDGTYCYILCDKDTVGKFDVTPTNVYLYRAQTEIDNIKLPKGKEYLVGIPSHFIRSAENPQKGTGNICFKFTVPEKFCAYDSWFLSRASETEHTFDFGNETAPFDGAKMLLYREDKLIMEFPIYEKDCSADFDLGVATSVFGRTLNFENGVNYAFVLPEGVIHCKERDDIVNAAAKHEFIGRYKNKFQPIACRSSKCELNGEEMGKVEFTFTDSVALTPNAVVQLLDAGGNVVSEKRPSLSVLGKKKEVLATLTADFSDVRLGPNASYTLCLPEATVVSTGSDIRVNSLYTREVSGEDTAVDGIETDGNQIITDIYTLSGVKRNTLTRGVNIVRLANGKMLKVKANGK